MQFCLAAHTQSSVGQSKAAWAGQPVSCLISKREASRASLNTFKRKNRTESKMEKRKVGKRKNWTCLLVDDTSLVLNTFDDF
jgi:hypothetical protein